MKPPIKMIPFSQQFRECVKAGFTRHAYYAPVECKRFGGMCHAKKPKCQELRQRNAKERGAEV